MVVASACQHLILEFLIYKKFLRDREEVELRIRFKNRLRLR